MDLYLMSGAGILLFPILFILGTKHRYGGKIIAYFKIVAGILIFLILLILALVLTNLLKKGDILGTIMIGMVCFYVLIRGYQIGHWLTIEGIYHLKTLKAGDIFDREKLLKFRKQRKGS